MPAFEALEEAEDEEDMDSTPPVMEVHLRRLDNNQVRHHVLTFSLFHALTPTVPDTKNSE
jgi:hypothetical protein